MEAEDKSIYADYIHYGCSMNEIMGHLGFRHPSINRRIKCADG